MDNNNNIFSSPPKIDYAEFDPPPNPGALADIIRSRRSVRTFDGKPIPPEIVNSCFDLALLAPTSSNLQCWEFYWVRDTVKKSALVKACLSQSAASTAGELIVAAARTKTWNQNRKQILRDLENISPKVPPAITAYYQKIVPFIYTQGFLSIFGFLRGLLFSIAGLWRPVPREPVSRGDMRLWAGKTTALACAHLMLSFRAYGYDTCPMEGFDAKRVKKILNLPRDASIVMVIGAGKRARFGIWGPRMRLPRQQFIKEI